MNMRQTQTPVSAFLHVRRTIGRALRNVLLTGLVFAVIGALLTEAVGAYLTRSYPTGPTHIAALVIALAVGYAAAVTVAFRALLTSIIQSMEWVVSEMEKVANRVIQQAETVIRPGEGTGGRSGPLSAPRTGLFSRSGAGLTDGVIVGVEDETPRASTGPLPLLPEDQPGGMAAVWAPLPPSGPTATAG